MQYKFLREWAESSRTQVAYLAAAKFVHWQLWSSFEESCQNSVELALGKWWKSGGQVWALLAIWQVLGFCFSVLHAKNVAPGIANFEKKHFPNGRGYQRLKNGCCFQDLHITWGQLRCTLGSHFWSRRWCKANWPTPTASPGQMPAIMSANFFGCFKSRFVCEMGGGAKAAIEVTSFLCLGILYSTWKELKLSRLHQYFLEKHRGSVSPTKAVVKLSLCCDAPIMRLANCWSLIWCRLQIIVLLFYPPCTCLSCLS